MIEALDAMAAVLRYVFPDATVSFTRPRDPNGETWLDVSRGQRGVVVQWRPGVGFGVSPVKAGTVYGEGADEVFTDYRLALNRVIALLEIST